MSAIARYQDLTHIHFFWFQSLYKAQYISCTYNVRSFDHLAIGNLVESHIPNLSVLVKGFLGFYLLLSSCIILRGNSHHRVNDSL